MNALSISRSCPLQSANFASEEFSAFLFRRPGLQPWRETIAFQWALAPEVRLRFTLIDGTRLQTLRRCSGRSSDRFFLLVFSLWILFGAQLPLCRCRARLFTQSGSEGLRRAAWNLATLLSAPSHRFALVVAGLQTGPLFFSDLRPPVIPNGAGRFVLSLSLLRKGRPAELRNLSSISNSSRKPPQ